MAQREFKCIYPQIQWVEQKPLDILNTTLDSCKEVLQKAEEMKGEISAIGITNQRETTIIGIKRLVNPFIMQLYGKIGEHLIFVIIF